MQRYSFDNFFLCLVHVDRQVRILSEEYVYEHVDANVAGYLHKKIVY
jgi:hypothetical protein